MTPPRHTRTAATLLAALLTVPLTATAHAQEDDVQHPWYFDTYRAEDIWQHTTGEGITVAVIDTGVDPTLPELEGQVLEGTDLTISGEGTDTDNDGHGTGMAALIAGTGAGGGIQGLAPGVDILPIRAYPGADEVDFGFERRFAEAVQYAADAGAQIISVSLATLYIAGSQEEVTEALEEAARQDILIFAGTGNDGATTNEVTFPNNQDGVVGVGAVDSSGQREPYSTYGPQVALAGPGENTPGHCDWDTQRDPCIFEGGGTSSATALVSASAALVWAAHPEWTKNQVLNALITTADGPGDGERNDQVGYGMVRPDRIILDNQGDPGDPDTNPLFAAWESLIDPPPSTEPNPTPTPHDNTPPPAGDTDTDDQAAADDTSEDTSGSNTTATLLLTLAAAVLLTGLTTAILLNRRARHGR